MISISTEIQIFNIGLCWWKALFFYAIYCNKFKKKKLELKHLLLVYTEKAPVVQNILCHFIERAIIMKTLLKQWDLPATDGTQEKFFNRCFPHQTDTYPSLIIMILKMHYLIQQSTPLHQSHLKKNHYVNRFFLLHSSW